jgi:3',5'-cyclic AMP phosphodiesterase CpdA
VVWITRSSEAKFGVKPGEWSAVLPVVRAQKVTYGALKPGTTYYYETAGGSGSFKTPGDGPFEFIVFGDTRTRHEMHQRVIDAMVKTDPEFVIHTGDLVTDGSDPALWPRFFSIEKELLKRAPFFPVLGNHERNTPQFYDFFDVKRAYYAFDWGNVHFTLLNTELNGIEDREAFWQEQTRWLEADLKASQKADLRIAVFHQPPFTAVKRRQTDGKKVREWVPLFEKYKVAAVFSGHDHNYQHHAKNGVHYIVTGGGGAPLYAVDAPVEGLTVNVESIEHFVRMIGEPGKVKLEAVALDGRILESFTITK